MTDLYREKVTDLNGGKWLERLSDKVIAGISDKGIGRIIDQVNRLSWDAGALLLHPAEEEKRRGQAGVPQEQEERGVDNWQVGCDWDVILLKEKEDKNIS